MMDRSPASIRTSPSVHEYSCTPYSVMCRILSKQLLDIVPHTLWLASALVSTRGKLWEPKIAGFILRAFAAGTAGACRRVFRPSHCRQSGKTGDTKVQIQTSQMHLVCQGLQPHSNQSLQHALMFQPSNSVSCKRAPCLSPTWHGCWPATAPRNSGISGRLHESWRR